ncbi:MAG: protein phosphatase 2C domain-containing protein [Luteolibacter sp.]
MHAAQSAHGKLGENIREWLDETSGAFLPSKFREDADKSIGSTENEIEADVVAFVRYAKYWIVLNSGNAYTEFKAENHTNCRIPSGFLKLLETCSTPESLRLQNMANFAELLKVGTEQNTEPSEIVESAPAPSVNTPAPDPAPPYIPNIRIALRNGTVGKPYEVEAGVIAARIANERGEPPQFARVSHLQLPPDSGLVFNESTGAVSGTPTRAFEETLLLDYAASPSAASIRFEISLLVNPDPASLWKDLDPSPDAPYQKVSLAHESFNYPDFRVVAASRRGRSHANKGDFRDDDFAVGYAETTGWLVVVVADGAGSAKYSRKGSSIACKVCRDWLVGSLNSPEYQNVGASKPKTTEGESKPVRPIRDLLYDAARLAHDKIDKESKNPSESLPEPPTLRNYDTTLILLLMKKMGDACIAASFSIGDGGAGILGSSGVVTPLTLPDGGEHAGQTTFLTIPSSLSVKPENLEKRYRNEVVQNFTAALSMTDGITDPKFPSDAAFADPACWISLWTELEPALESSESLLEWMNFFSPGNHDDRTLVAVLPQVKTASE